MRAGFTLVELLISIGLGSVIVVTAFAAFRVAAQCTSVANRLSLENAMMRAGVQVADLECDYWSLYDDPLDPTQQRLRQTRGAKGLPFSPFATTVVDDAGDTRPLWERGTLVGTLEPERGWDEANAWPIADRATWWQGDYAEKYFGGSGQPVGGIRHGRYALFANTEAELDVWTNKDPGDYGYVRPPHTWLCNQLVGAIDALGYYGLCDYMPSNQIYAAYTAFDPNPSVTGPGGLWGQLTHPGYGFANWELTTPRDLYRLTFIHSLVISDPHRTADVNQLMNENRNQYQLTLDSDIANFSAITGNANALLAL